jgi:uncharacterized MAPEG superfamily protein
MIAGLLPIIAASIAKAGAHADNKLPRDAVLTGYRRRANAAHFNSYEAFPLFAVAVILNLIHAAPTALLDGLVIAYVIARIFYIACYIGDWDGVRSVLFMVALVINIAIFAIPILQI